jgi:hypothetical protein
MKYALNLAEDGRVLSVGMYAKATYIPSGAVLVDSFPEPVTDYLYKDGEFVYSPLPRSDDNAAEEGSE